MILRLRTYKDVNIDSIIKKASDGNYYFETGSIMYSILYRIRPHLNEVTMIKENDVYDGFEWTINQSNINCVSFDNFFISDIRELDKSHFEDALNEAKKQIGEMT